MGLPEIAFQSRRRVTSGEGGALRTWIARLWSPEDDRRRVAVSPMGRVLLLAGVVLYTFQFATWTIRNHDGYGTYGFDLGIYDQGLWLLSHLKDPFVTIMGRNLFGDHTSFILLPFVPLYRLLPSPKLLLAAQAVALGSAAVPVFLIAREKIRHELLAGMIAVAFLVQPALGWTNMEQFHPDVFEVPLLLFAFWFMVRERWRGFLTCVVLLLLVKEDVALVTFALGVYVGSRYDRRVGLVTCAMSALYFTAAVWGILPALNGVGSLNGWRIPFGGPWGFVRTAFTHPGRVVSYALQGDRTWYVWQLLAPMALLSLLSPTLILVAIAPLAANVLSTFWYQYHIQYHYATLILPVLVVAAIFGIARFRSMALRAGLVVLMTVCAMASGWAWGPASFARHPAPIGDPRWSEIRYIRAATRLVPPDASVSAFYAYVTHMEHRTRIYEFPTPWLAHNWGAPITKFYGQRLPDADTVTYVIVPDALPQESADVLDSIRSEFDTIYNRGGLVLLKRKSGA